MNRRLLLVCLVAAVTSASAWLDAQAQSQAPVKIGGITFITGKFGSYGQEYANGMRLGVDYVNKHGGVLGGRKLELDLQAARPIPPKRPRSCDDSRRIRRSSAWSARRARRTSSQSSRSPRR
jgi:hypothetical protein